MLRARRFLASLFATALLMAGLAAPASAQVFQGPALVNVTLIVEDVTVQVPIGIAANLCDINAAVLVGQFQDTGSAECTATAESIASRGPGNRGGGGGGGGGG